MASYDFWGDAQLIRLRRNGQAELKVAEPGDLVAEEIVRAQSLRFGSQTNVVPQVVDCVRSLGSVDG